MAPVRELSFEQRVRIVLLDEDVSERKIAERMKISKTGVHNTIKHFKETGQYCDLPRPGQPRKIDEHGDRRITRLSISNRKSTAPQIMREYNETAEKLVCVRTIKNRLMKAGLTRRVAAKKPLLRKVNKVKRLQWARKHANWTISQWKTVVWSDESKFELFGNKRRIFVRRHHNERYVPQCIVPTVKDGGGSIMIWDCFAGHKIGDLIRVRGIMKKEQYREISENYTVPSAHRMVVRRQPVFMQDNDPKHKSKLSANYLNQLVQEKTLTLMGWPAQSPDLDPIELLWDEIDRYVKKFQVKSEAHLWELLLKASKAVTMETLNKLIFRMPRICEAVMKKRGGYFDERKV